MSKRQEDTTLYKNLEVKCNLLQGHTDRDDIRVCGNCDACHLQYYSSRTLDWFLRASENTKKIFLCGLARRMTNSDLITYVQHLIQPIASKDYTYSRSRSAPGIALDDVPSHGDRTIDLGVLEAEIFSVWSWFANASHYAKINYMLELLKICDSHLLLTLQHQMRTVSVSNRRQLVETILKKHDKNEEETDYHSDESDETFITDKHPDLAFLKECKDPKDFTANAKNPLSGKTFARESRQRKQQRLRALTKVKSDDKDVKGARTGPKKGQQGGLKSVWSEDEEVDPALTIPPHSDVAASGVDQYKDFIRELPVFISKYVLNQLDKPDLVKCTKVSRIWKVVASQVIEEGEIQMKLQEQYTILQGSSAKGCNPAYAKDIVCLAPEVDSVEKQPLLLPGYDPAPQDFTPNGQISFQSAFFGHVTRQIYVEERNVFCGSYNTLILVNNEDTNRIIHYVGGSLIAKASDKKLELIKVEDGSALHKKPIIGHAGSIQCAYIDEKDGYVLTGSYDTSVRMWDIESGACRRIFRGHTDSIFALTKYLDVMVTGSKDTTVKVWDISRGVVTTTFKHKDAVLCVDLHNERLISGDQGGAVRVWDLRAEELVKECLGHVGAVLCVKSDKWNVASGGRDGNVLLWSTVGKFTRCLGMLRHPKPVMNVHVQDMRVVSGCLDGKLRVWNLLTGDCLRLLRGNSRSEPIFHMWPSGDNRIILNTLSNVVALNFQQVDFDYSLDTDRPEVIRVRTRAAVIAPQNPKDTTGGGGVQNLNFKQSHAYLRAQKMKRVGSANERILRHPEMPGATGRPPSGPGQRRPASAVSVSSRQRATSAKTRTKPRAQTGW